MSEDDAVFPQTTSESQQLCRNCGRQLLGEYCSNCGQRERGKEIRLTDLMADALDDLVHPGSRLWRTLGALLFRPGMVTAEYLEGRRARYLPPVRLYLVISFLLLLCLSLLPESVNVQLADPGDPAVMTELEQQGILDDPEVRERVEKALERGQVEEDADDRDVDIDLWGDGEKPPWIAALEEKMESNVRLISEDPGEFTEQLLERLPQLLFLLLPVFALLVHFCYLFSGTHYLQHLLFSIHYHSFIFLLSLMLFPVNLLYDMDLGAILVIASGIYLPLALKRVYRSSTGGAVGKSLFLYFSYGISVILAGVVFFLVNLATL